MHVSPVWNSLFLYQFRIMLNLIYSMYKLYFVIQTAKKKHLFKTRVCKYVSKKVN